MYNYNELSLNLSGWTKCYDQPYSHITTTAELAACAGTICVFVGAAAILPTLYLEHLDTRR